MITRNVWEEAVIPHSSYYCRICLRSLRKITKNLKINGVATKILSGHLMYTHLTFYRDINLPGVSLHQTNLSEMNKYENARLLHSSILGSIILANILTQALVIYVC